MKNPRPQVQTSPKPLADGELGPAGSQQKYQRFLPEAAKLPASRVDAWSLGRAVEQQVSPLQSLAEGGRAPKVAPARGTP